MPRKKPAPRRTPKEIAVQATKVVRYLKYHGPCRMEKLVGVFQTTAEKMGPIMRWLGIQRLVVADGNTRATEYKLNPRKKTSAFVKGL